ncbi:hypothetical protein HDU76_009897 [Blyttiomyces sp. JEL0837]|nr:hypothetical protein HDU76_009897 [Blyttiomyces sp. JEL0837]
MMQQTDHDRQSSAAVTSTIHVHSIPTLIWDQILELLNFTDLIQTSQTCRFLRSIIASKLIPSRLVFDNVQDSSFTSIINSTELLQNVGNTDTSALNTTDLLPLVHVIVESQLKDYMALAKIFLELKGAVKDAFNEGNNDELVRQNLISLKTLVSSFEVRDDVNLWEFETNLTAVAENGVLNRHSFKGPKDLIEAVFKFREQELRIPPIVQRQLGPALEIEKETFDFVKYVNDLLSTNPKPWLRNTSTTTPITIPTRTPTTHSAFRLPLDLALFQQWRSQDYNRLFRQQSYLYGSGNNDRPQFILYYSKTNLEWKTKFELEIGGRVVYKNAIGNSDDGDDRINGEYVLWYFDQDAEMANTTTSSPKLLLRVLTDLQDFDDAFVYVDCTPGGYATSSTFGAVFIVDKERVVPVLVAENFSDYLRFVSRFVESVVLGDGGGEEEEEDEREIELGGYLNSMLASMLEEDEMKWQRKMRSRPVVRKPPSAITAPIPVGPTLPRPIQLTGQNISQHQALVQMQMDMIRQQQVQKGNTFGGTTGSVGFGVRPMSVPLQTLQRPPTSTPLQNLPRPPASIPVQNLPRRPIPNVQPIANRVPIPIGLIPPRPTVTSVPVPVPILVPAATPTTPSSNPPPNLGYVANPPVLVQKATRMMTEDGATVENNEEFKKIVGYLRWFVGEMESKVNNMGVLQKRNFDKAKEFLAAVDGV